MAEYGVRSSSAGGQTNATYSYTTGHAPQHHAQQPFRAGGPTHYPTPMDHTYENLPYSPKYPPSMDPSRSISQVSVSNENLPPSGASGQQVSVSEIAKKLDFATRENLRLKDAIEQNSRFMEQKLSELQAQPKQAHDAQQKEVQMLKKKVTEATNRFFEARIAVMGFRCKVMQLQGELEKKTESSPLRQELAEKTSRLKAVEEERDRLQQEVSIAHEQIRDKEGYIQQLNVHLSQAQADKQNYHDHTLRGQIQELTTIRSNLEGEVGRLKTRNDNLLVKVKELQQNRDLMMEKLKKVEGSVTSPVTTPTPPTPKPRLGEKERLERDVQRLQEEVGTLEEEREHLRAQKDRAIQDKTAIDNMFQQSNEKSQELTARNIALERDIGRLKQQLEEKQLGAAEGARAECERLRRECEQLQAELDGMGSECEALRGEVSSEKKEKDELSSQLSKVKKLKQALEDDVEGMKKSREEARQQTRRYMNELRDAEEKMTSDLTSLSRGTSAATAKRLNDAMGKIRHLEGERSILEEKVRDGEEEHERLLNQLRIEMESVEEDLRREKEVNSRAVMENYSKLQREHSDLQAREQRQSQLVRELEEEQQQQVTTTIELRNKLDQYRQELAQYDTEKRTMSHQLSSKEVEYNQMESQLKELNERLAEEVKERTRKASKLETLQKSYSELKAQCMSVETSKQQLQEEVEHTSTRLIHVNTDLEQLQREKEELRNMGDEFRKESESILSDYNVCAQRLKEAQAEAGRWSQQHQKAVTELERQKERVRLLEEQRRELEEKLSHMDQQIKIYHEDFDRERNAREAAVKVKNLAEDRMKKKDKEIKELRERLNHQAQRSLYDDSSFSSSHDTLSPQRYSGPHSKSGEQYVAPDVGMGGGGGGGGGAGGWISPGPTYHPQSQRLPHLPPPSSSPSSSHVHDTLSQRRSGEQRSSGDHGYVTGGGGGGGGALPGPHDPVYRAGGGGGAWTTQVPAGTHSTYSQSRTTINPPNPHHRDHMDYGTVNDLNNPPPPPSSSTGRSQDYEPAYRAAIPPAMGRPYQEGGGVLRAGSGGGFDPPRAGGGRGGMMMEHSRPGGGMMDPPRAGGGAGGGLPPMGHMIPGGGGGGGSGPTLPGDIDNQAPPTMACPLCGRENFKTQTELEVHSAQCDPHLLEM